MTGDRPTLIALRALGLGDALTGLPALRALADAYPGHRRIVAAPRRLEPLLVGEGGAHEVIDHHGLSPLPPSLGRPDIAVDLHGRGPASQPVLLALQPKRLIAFAHPGIPATAGGPRWRPGEHEVHRWCRLLTENGIPADPRRLGIRPSAGPVPPAARGATVVHPGAASAARRWPAERFAAVARAEVGRGRMVLVTGTADERPVAARVAHQAGLDPACVLAGDTDIATLSRVVAAAGRVVCGDTGMGHLATALGTPSVVLFGPVPPAEWGPPPESRRHVALWKGQRGDPHGERIDAGLLAITIEEVERALADLLADDSPIRHLSIATAGEPT